MDRHPRLSSEVSPRPGRAVRTCALGVAAACLSLAIGASAPSFAQESVSGTSMSVPLAPNAPDTYVVKKGDTLWDISKVFLRDPWYWPEIWYVNPEIENPHLIYPGDVLRLIYVNGQPRLTVGVAGEVRLSPQVRTEPLASAIRAIPYELLMNFVGRPQILTRDEVRNQPYVVGIRDRHMVGSEQNEIYGKGIDATAVGSRYTIIDVGQQLRDPDDGDLLGYIGHFAGTGEIIDGSGSHQGQGLAHMRVVESGREILQGDRL